MTEPWHVKPGGPAVVHHTEKLSIKKFAVSQLCNNVYVLTCRTTGTQAIIDAADEPERILSELAEPLTSCTAIITTHRHWDHVRALEATQHALPQAETMASANDAPALPVPTTRQVADGDVITVGECSLSVMTLTGHTPGGIALAYTESGQTHIFSGDSLFPGGLGKTTSPEDFTQLWNDVTQKIFDRYLDTTVIHPGHGDNTTVGDERPHLRQWQQRGW